MSSPKAVLYDPDKTFDDNFDHGPFPASAGKPYVDQGEPKFSFLGHKVYSPFGIPAGPLPTSKHVKYAFEQGFDIICYKTQRSMPAKCNDFPNVLYLDVEGDLTLEKAAKPIVGKNTTNQPADKISITNSFGNPSRGPGFWMDDLKKAVSYQGNGQLLIMSICGTIVEGQSQEEYFEDFAVAAEMAVKAGAPAVELNLSCPNVATEGVLCYSHDAVVEVCKRTRAKVGKTPIVAKFGYFSADQQELLEKTMSDIDPYISAVSAINTISAPIVDEKGEQALPGEGRLKSGVCGAGVKWAGLDMVKRLVEMRKRLGLKYEIIGVGGVMSAKDFQEYRKAGADAVQSATGAMWNPGLAAEVKANLN